MILVAHLPNRGGIHGLRIASQTTTHCSLVLWFFGSLVLWFFGSLVLWFFALSEPSPVDRVLASMPRGDWAVMIESNA
jgi:hypothetical protein